MTTIAITRKDLFSADSESGKVIFPMKKNYKEAILLKHKRDITVQKQALHCKS